MHQYDAALDIRDIPVDYRKAPIPTREPVVLRSRMQNSGRRRANRARFSRSSGARAFSGAHRRRLKRA